MVKKPSVVFPSTKSLEKHIKLKGMSPKNSYLRRYKTCFIIGIIILIFQLLFAGFFFDLNNKYKRDIDHNQHQYHQWEPSDSDSSSNNEALNSARRSDDEETNLLAPQIKKTLNSSWQMSEDFNFELPCIINEKQALSALNRAKTQRCKQLIANITCLINEDVFYPDELISTCPKGESLKGKELGCFKDEKTLRLLNGYFGTNLKDNSPKYCIDLCLQSGFPYAGVQYSQECFCGSYEPPFSAKIPDSSCNMKCPGDVHQTCGGYYTINIFQTGIKKFTPQIANETLSNPSEGAPIKIVFLLTLNGRALRQVKRLIKLIYHKNHYYFIHVDVRQDYLFRELLALENFFPNIRLTRNRFATIWGGASLLKMLLSSMRELLDISNWKWDFVLNLSESDFPVKPVERLTRFLSENRNKNFVKSHGREVQRFIQKQGLDKTFIECEYRMWRVGNRKLPNGIQMDGGSDWVALNKNFVEYVTNSAENPLISGLLKVFSYTLLPAESFFHTALRNSKFCNSYVDNNLHVTNWKRKLGCKCQYKHVVDWCGCSPNDFTPEDWPKILNTNSRQLFFARKFEPIINQAVILQLELWLFNLDKPTKNVENLHSYWQNLYHYQDLNVPVDDILMIFADSVKRNVESNSTLCNLHLNSLQQVHSFHSNDKYRYTLFQFSTSYNDSIEIAISSLNNLIVTKSSPLMNHLISLKVSSHYDQKEQQSRNFLGLLSPHSEPIIAYKFSSFKNSLKPSSSSSYNLTCLWIDPAGNLREISTFSLDNANLLGHVKATFKPPHLPGIWKIKILYKDSSLLAQITFPIFPFMEQQQQISTNNNNNNLQQINNSKIYGKFLPSVSEKRILEENAQKNSQKIDHNLAEWIDELFKLFFNIKFLCIDNNNEKISIKVPSDECGILSINFCKSIKWSSFAPDPKSAIDQLLLNNTTGMFNVW